MVLFIDTDIQLIMEKTDSVLSCARGHPPKFCRHQSHEFQITLRKRVRENNTVYCSHSISVSCDRSSGYISKHSRECYGQSGLSMPSQSESSITFERQYHTIFRRKTPRAMKRMMFFKYTIWGLPWLSSA